VFTQEGAEASNHFTRPQIVSTNVFENLPHLGQRLRSGLQQQFGGVSIAQDGAEWLVNLMGDGSREFTREGQTGCVCQLLPCFLGPFPRGDIHDNVEDKGVFACLNGSEENLDGKRAAVFPLAMQVAVYLQRPGRW